MGRQDWNGIKPVEKVIPSKKKPISTRKRKHKGRESDPYLFLGSFFPSFSFGNAL